MGLIDTKIKICALNCSYIEDEMSSNMEEPNITQTCPYNIHVHIYSCTCTVKNENFLLKKIVTVLIFLLKTLIVGTC